MLKCEHCGKSFKTKKRSIYTIQKHTIKDMPKRPGLER